jgi:hypothetical protein
MEQSGYSIIGWIAFVGNYLPRQCGTATFTTDLCKAIAGECRGTACIAIPVNDTEAGHAYPDRLRLELVEKDIESCRRASQVQKGRAGRLIGSNVARTGDTRVGAAAADCDFRGANIKPSRGEG